MIPTVSPTDVDVALAQVAAQGLRRTTACRAVIAALHERPGLMAREVHDRLSVAAVRVDLTTVHRVLHRLERAGVVVSLPHHGAVSYRIAGAARDCLVCQDCGRTASLPADLVAALLAAIAGSGFDVDPVVLSGRCPRCLVLSRSDAGSAALA